MDVPGGKDKTKVFSLLKKAPHHQWTFLCRFSYELAKSLGIEEEVFWERDERTGVWGR